MQSNVDYHSLPHTFQSTQGTDANSEDYFGCFLGNYLPNILTQWGAVIFLLIPMAVHRDGFWNTIIANGFAAILSLLNGCVIAQISKQIDGSHIQGITRIISSIYDGNSAIPVTILFSIGQIFALVLYILGFTSMLYGVRSQHHHDEQFMEMTLLVAFVNFLLLIGGLRIAAKIQVVFFVIIIAALGAYCTIGFLQEKVHETEKPATWHNFLQAFALVATPHFGILTGLNMPLKNPRNNVPIGTFSSILTYFITSNTVALASMFYQRKGHHMVFPHRYARLIYGTGVFCATESSIVGVWTSLGEILHQFLSPYHDTLDRATSHFTIFSVLIILLLFEPSFEMATTLSTCFLFSTFICLYFLVLFPSCSKA